MFLCSAEGNLGIGQGFAFGVFCFSTKEGGRSYAPCVAKVFEGMRRAWLVCFQLAHERSGLATSRHLKNKEGIEQTASTSVGLTLILVGLMVG